MGTHLFLLVFFSTNHLLHSLCAHGFTFALLINHLLVLHALMLESFRVCGRLRMHTLLVVLDCVSLVGPRVQIALLSLPLVMFSLHSQLLLVRLRFVVALTHLHYVRSLLFSLLYFLPRLKTPNGTKMKTHTHKSVNLQRGVFTNEERREFFEII